MRPYGLKGSVRFPVKKDVHPRRGLKNWWDDIQKLVSRRKEKQELEKKCTTLKDRISNESI